MISSLRTTFAMILALTLAIASVGFVQARHLAVGAETVVICTGYGLVHITIDADGNPVERTLPCPDCVVVPLALAPAFSAVPLPVISFSVAAWALLDNLHTAAAAGQWHSPRAPPHIPV